MKLALRHSGETILEVLVSVSVIMIVIGPASALFIASTHDTAVNRAELAALSLAEEGVELLRNIRDSNLLKFPSTPECWMTAPEVADVTVCAAPENQISAGYFSVALNPEDDSLPIVLSPNTAAFAPDDPASAGNQVYRLLLDASADGTYLYNHARGEPSDFFREVEIEMASDSANVSSSVYYFAGGKLRTVNFSAVFTRPAL